jgi:tetratricopeptide (TPR) repeat protein/SAM-dependent methyltransferase
MPNCPVCSNEALNKITNTPYWDCKFCGCWWQNPLPPKVFEGQHEKDDSGHSAKMSDFEKDINRSLATSIFTNYMSSKPGKCLDIGSKYPYMSHCFNEFGCVSYGMDSIDEVDEYSKELNVPMVFGDFEKLSAEEILSQTTGGEKFNLITMIHMFEHLYNPIEALKKLKDLLTDDGVLFLRLPQHDVSGFERDLQDSHYKIHPYYHSFSSVLECLVQAKDAFIIEVNTPMEGAGQRDIVLRPIKKKPTIWAGMIVKNEERDLPICLNTIQDVVDGIVIMDTGSIDKTEETAKNMWRKPMIYETYTGASKRDDIGDWKLFDFGKARNQFVDKIEAMPEIDYLIWFDADDTLLTPGELKRAIYLNQYDHFGMMIDSGGLQWVHHRMWKTKRGYNFAGRIHEYPVLNSGNGTVLQNVIIHHDAAPGIGETSNERNLRILLEELKENPTDSRTLFYTANTYKDAGKYKEAIPYYASRISQIGYWDEWITAYLYKGRCERAAGLVKEAEATLLEGLSHAPDWSELWMELGYIFCNINKQLCISYCMQAANRPNTPTQLWREANKYTDQPRRLLSFCYQDLGDIEQALRWAKEAKLFIDVQDDDWDKRISALTSILPHKEEIKQDKAMKIALVRPGAVGDVIMISNVIPELRAKYPEAVIDFYTKIKGLEPILVKAGVNHILDCDVLELREHEYDAVKYLIGYPVQSEGYPNHPMKKHLLEYFLDEINSI